MAVRKYLDFRASEFSLGSEIALWGKEEDTPQVFQDDLATTDLMLFVEEFSPEQEIVYHDDEQRRSGSRSRRDAIRGRTNHGSVDSVGYVRPSGTRGNVPQSATLYDGVFGDGAQAIGTDVTVQAISAVDTTSDRTFTKFTVPDGTDFVVGQAIALVSNDAGSADADAEARWISAIASNDLTVTPGFSAIPIAASDQVQAGVTYTLNYAYTSTRSFLAKDGHLSHQLLGSAVEAMSLVYDGTNILKVTHTIGFQKQVTCGTDQILGDGTLSSFGAGDTALQVMDARVFEPDTWINLIEYLISDGSTVSTETKAKITAVNYTTNILTVTRGGGTPASPAKLVATKTGEAGPFDTTTAYNLDVNIDFQGWVTLDADDGAGHGTGLARADAATNLNKQLAKLATYGYNTKGGVDISWGLLDGTGVFDGSGSTLDFTSPFCGTQSRFQVRASASNSAHTLLFLGVVDEVATEEVQIVPWTPTISAAAETGAAVHNYAGWLFWNGFKLGVNEFTVNINNNVLWLEEEKRDDPFPAGFVAQTPRTVEVTMSGYFYGQIPRLFYAAKNDIFNSAVIQTGKTAGYIVAANVKRFKVASPEISGDQVRNFSITLKVSASSALEDEFAMAFL